MNIDDFIAAAKNTVLTAELIKEFNERLKAFDQKCELEARQRRVTNEWLNRSYDL